MKNSLILALGLFGVIAVLPQNAMADCVLCASAESGDRAAMKAIIDDCVAEIDQGNEPAVNVDGKDSSERTALYLAAENNRKKIVRLLLKNDCANANPNVPGGVDEETPLIAAVRNKNAGIVTRLLKEDNIDLEAKQSDGKTALWFALNKKKPEIMRQLIGNGAKTSNLKNTPSAEV
ncbi:MAG: ankyrin repeat domain-containing protein, partial [Gammaproteobacteria bacterium]